MDWKYGDKLLCTNISQAWSHHFIQVGKVYTFKCIDHYRSEFINIVEAKDIVYLPTRFVKLENLTELEKILYNY